MKLLFLLFIIIFIHFLSFLNSLNNNYNSQITGSIIAGIGTQAQIFLGPSKMCCEFCSIGLELSSKTGILGNIAQAIIASSLTFIFFKNLQEIEILFNQIKISIMKSVDVNQIAYIAAFKILLSMEYSKPLPLLRESANDMIKIFQNIDCYPIYIIRSISICIQLLSTGKNSTPFESDDEHIPMIWKASSEIFKLLTFYILNKDEDVSNSLQKLDEYIPKTQNLLPYFEYAFIGCLSQIRILTDENLLVTIVKNSLKTLKICSSISPNNFEHKYLIIKAEKLRLKNAPIFEILKCYEKAILLSENNHFYYVGAIAADRAYELLSNDDVGIIGKAFIEKSYFLYKTWGAVGKCLLIQQENQYFRNFSPIGRSTRSSGELASSLNPTTIEDSLSSIVLDHATKLLTSEGSVKKIITVISMVSKIYIYIHYYFHKVLPIYNFTISHLL